MQSTRLGTSRSEELIVTHGVPQGSILGPLMFSLYMNDLPSVVKFSSVETYAGDTKVYLSISPKDIDSCLTKLKLPKIFVSSPSGAVLISYSSILVEPNLFCLEYESYYK